MTASDVNRTIDAVWRIESARLIAGLARIVRDVGLAEDLAHDALVAALEQWPESGVPDNPGAWLMATAKHRAIDRLRRSEMAERKHQELGRELQINQALAAADWDAAIEDVGDDVLRLIFTTCHPVLSREARVALTLRLLGGLTTPEIARAFLVPESTVAQRIVRAKRTLAETNVAFEVPDPKERAARMSSVLEVIYIVFNEGYSATAGKEWLRPSLEAEALRLGRVLAALAPKDPEVHGLVALMEIQASRSRARVTPSGEPILLLDQDRGRWDYVLIGRGLAALERAEQLGGRLGPYALQAAIAACHARARTPEQTDWQRIVALYDALAQVSPSPVVELNRAVALGMAFGPEAGLELVDQLTDEPALAYYHLLPSVRGDLLEKLGRLDEAREEFSRAASLTQNEPERKLLLERRRRLRLRLARQSESGPGSAGTSTACS
jgi:RNA polymerase sigma factor (sigma-70 family)